MKAAAARSGRAIFGCTLVGCVVAALVPHAARANGRFPYAQQVAIDPVDPNHIVGQVTYGFVETFNHGTDWKWTCEDAIPYGGVLDPPLTIMQDGTLIAAVFDGLSVGSEKNCQYNFATAPVTPSCKDTLTDLNGRFAVDVARDAKDATHAITLTSNGCGNDLFDTRLFVTNDMAKTWSQLGASLPLDFLALTSDLAPSDAKTIYVSGFKVNSPSDYAGELARSTDAGATWELLPIPGSDDTAAPYIGAVDPNDPKTVYVRFAEKTTGHLLVSHDAGNTWTTIYTAKGPLLGFALSPDGKKVVTGGESDGVMRASTADLAFTQISTIHTRCLTWIQLGSDPEKVYACANEAYDGFTIGESLDEGATFTPIHHLQCLEGPVGCGADTSVTQKCQDPWTITAQTIQADTCTSASSAASSSASATSTGGDDTAPTGGCCSIAGDDRSAWGAPAIAGVAALGALVRLRRRDRRSRQETQR